MRGCREASVTSPGGALRAARRGPRSPLFLPVLGRLDCVFNSLPLALQPGCSTPPPSPISCSLSTTPVLPAQFRIRQDKNRTAQRAEL